MAANKAGRQALHERSEQSSKFEAKVRHEWIDDATAAAWRKWHGKSVRFWSNLTDELLKASQLEAGHRVLDPASGTGDPALTVAERVGPSGHVVATDLAPQMLDIARANSESAGQGNMSFVVVDAHAIPLEDEVFDRVTCQLGVMFFWDCACALGEIRRVLKPGGIASFVAWGPVEQVEYIGAAMAPFKMPQPPPAAPPGAPQPYRFVTPGSLSAELRAAGFPMVREEARTVGLDWPGTAEELWTRIYEVSAPLRPYFNSFEPGVRADAVKEAIANLSKYSDGQEVKTKSAGHKGPASKYIARYPPFAAVFALQ